MKKRERIKLLESKNKELVFRLKTLESAFLRHIYREENKHVEREVNRA
jgi:hypothetical protein